MPATLTAKGRWSGSLQGLVSAQRWVYSGRWACSATLATPPAHQAAMQCGMLPFLVALDR
jgi:hypothetical protein